MLGSRINLPIPGGWSKGEGSAAEGNQDQDVPRSVAAGLVDEKGNVVDETGKTVAKITEGEPQNLTGNVVAATGDIVSSAGDVVGKAVPLGGEGKDKPEDEGKGGNYTLKGVTDTVGGVADTVGGTVNTVNKLQPLTGQLTKGLGVGGGSEASTQKQQPAKAASEAAPAQSEVEGTKSGLGEIPEDKEQKPIDLQDKSVTDVSGDKKPTTDGGIPDVESAKPDTSAVQEEKPVEANTDSSVADKATPDDSKSQLPEVNASEAKPEETAAPATEVVDEAKTEMPAKDELTPQDSVSMVGKSAGGEKAPDALTEENLNVIDNPEEMQIKDDATGVEKPSESPAGSAPGEQKTEVPAGDVPEGSKAEVPAATEVKSTAPTDAPSKVPTDAPTEVKDGASKDIPAEEGVPSTEDGDAPTGDVPAEEEGEKVDFSVLKGCQVNKAGNVVNDKSQVIGRIISGILKNLIGRKTDENGEIWNDSGKIIGKAEPIPEHERDEFKEPAPFEDFPDAVVESNGKVMYNGEAIGIVVEGDPKKLKGKKVDEDGDILDRAGNKLGRAERWEEEEPEPEPEVVTDRSILAGKRVNKLGNVCDSSGTIYGRLIEGDPKRLAGRMCDKEGNVRSESGDIIGRAEVVPEGEREGVKEGPFSELEGCTVSKDGRVVTPSGDVVGRLIKGDPKVLFGRSVDDDGDILDKNGNVLGKAERWEEPEKEPEPEKPKGPMFGRKINREGNVVDADGNLIGKLTSGELSICAGKEIDADGDVVDSKGTTVGHASLLADIPPVPEPEPAEPEETPEEKAKREQAEEDRKLAQKMAATLTQCLDRVKPICKMITAKIEKADRTPKEELDEESLVKEVKPLIEEGSKILQEANGIIRGLDPDGHIQANAKHKTAGKEATPEEYHLADVLKELTGTVTECIDNAKKKIEDMPHAKKELNPLWGLMTEPLFQILAAVGLLLNGVLELVGRLLSGLGLGGIVNNILGGLGITNVLKSLGVGGVVDALTGKQKSSKKKSGGGLFG